MNSEVAIEKAKLSDLNSILEIENISFSSDNFSKRQFIYLITKAKGEFFVLKINGHVKAYLSLLYRKGTSNLRIYSIAVSKEVRGMNLATKLIDEAIEFAKQNKMKSLSLEVKIDNVPAIKLYDKKGFVKTNIKYGYYHDNSDAYVMVLYLK